MKNILLLVYLVLIAFISNAQKVDYIYQSCQTSLDKDKVGIVVVHDPGLIFDTCPQFSKGEAAFYKYISRNLHFPKGQEEVTGKVWVRMVIEKNGNITNVSIVRGVTNEMNKEALRVIKASPKWKPAILNRKPVRSYYFVPVNFTIY